MAWLEVRPGGSLKGRVRLAGDKSLSHRALVLAAMATGESRIANLLVAGVTRPMIRALEALGLKLELSGRQVRVVSPGFRKWPPPGEAVYCGHSATTMRLLAGALAAAGVPAVLDGSPGLRRRPMRRVVEPLQRMGVPIEDIQGHPPLRLRSRAQHQPLRGGVFRLPVASAQVKSAVLLAGLAAAEAVEILEPAPSRDHTERMFQALGLPLQFGPGWARLEPVNADLPPLNLELPGDISSAAFLIAAAVITPGSEVRLENVLLNPTRTGFLDVLQAMGADVQTQFRGLKFGEPVGDVLARYSPDLEGVEVAGELVVRMIDEFPIFALVATRAQGVTQVRDARELRYKESDRIARLVAQLRRLGVQAEEREDGFVITGGVPLQEGEVESFQDHRLAMALALAGLVATGPVRVREGEVHRESFPEFVEVLRALGGRARLVEA